MFISWLPKWLTGKPKTIKRSPSPSSQKKNRRRLELEALEERRLFSVTITEFGNPQTITGHPLEITAGSDGALWFSEQNPGRIGRIDTSGKITEFSTGLSPNSVPEGIAAGPDGNIWFTDANFSSPKIGRITITADHTITEFPVAGALQGLPLRIAAGPDNALWFTEQVTDPNGFIGRITTTGTVTNEFGVPSNSFPVAITKGPDNNMWFTEENFGGGPDGIGKITTDASHTITEFLSLPSQSSPNDITTGPDGALWFTESGFNNKKLGRIPTSATVGNPGITEFALPANPNVSPIGIATGPDQNLWFTAQDDTFNGNDLIGRFSPTAPSNKFTFFNHTNGLSNNAGPVGITLGPDNALWFAENQFQIHQIGRLSINGPVAAGTALTEVQGHTCTDNVATFSDKDTGETASNFTVTINWGDGTPLDTTTGVVTQTGTSSAGNTYAVSGTHAYATKGPFTIAVTIHDIADNIDGTATSTAQVISGNEAFVRALYRDVLLRTFDQGGLNAWVNALDSGAINRGQAAGGFTTSRERRGLEVDQDYLAIMGRPSDPAGRVAFVNALVAGVSEGNVAIAMLLSPEYAGKHDNNAFVQDLFRVTLERTPSSAEAAAWVQLLNVGVLSRAEVAVLFLSSTEAYTLAIDQNYQVFLRRFPDAGGFGAFFAGILNNSIDSTKLSVSILGSEEYFTLNIDNCGDDSLEVG